MKHEQLNWCMKDFHVATQPVHIKGSSSKDKSVNQSKILSPYKECQPKPLVRKAGQKRRSKANLLPMRFSSLCISKDTLTQKEK